MCVCVTGHSGMNNNASISVVQLRIAVLTGMMESECLGMRTDIWYLYMWFRCQVGGALHDMSFKRWFTIATDFRY